MAKVCQETHLRWDQVLLALLQIRAAPQSRVKVSPFETVYGRPFQASVLETFILNIEQE